MQNPRQEISLINNDITMSKNEINYKIDIKSRSQELPMKIKKSLNTFK